MARSRIGRTFFHPATAYTIDQKFRIEFLQLKLRKIEFYHYLDLFNLSNCFFFFFFFSMAKYRMERSLRRRILEYIFHR